MGHIDPCGPCIFFGVMAPIGVICASGAVVFAEIAKHFGLNGYFQFLAAIIGFVAITSLVGVIVAVVFAKGKEKEKTNVEKAYHRRQEALEVALELINIKHKL